jgi:cation:H+ antiporter
VFAKLVRPLALCVGLTVPALVLRLSGATPSPVIGLVLFGMAVVAASFILAWAAEAAQVDISGGLAIAILAVIAVLPEYFVDLYFAYIAGPIPPTSPTPRRT